jgi:hypothetical protein
MFLAPYSRTLVYVSRDMQRPDIISSPGTIIHQHTHPHTHHRLDICRNTATHFPHRIIHTPFRHQQQQQQQQCATAIPGTTRAPTLPSTGTTAQPPSSTSAPATRRPAATSPLRPRSAPRSTARWQTATSRASRAPGRAARASRGPTRRGGASCRGTCCRGTGRRMRWRRWWGLVITGVASIARGSVRFLFFFSRRKGGPGSGV